MADLFAGCKLLSPFITTKKNVRVRLEFDFGPTGPTNGKIPNVNADEDFTRLCDDAKSVKITLLEKPQHWASFSGSEARAICGGAWPQKGNLDDIRGAVLEREAYPLQKVDLSGGGKTFQAQGQTRKPGSHKDNAGHK